MPSALPNLFTFATSELSQDAWICWLVAHVDCDDRPELRNAARDFIARIWNLARPTEPIARNEVGGLREGHPLRQHERIDVLFEVGVGDRRVVFIVEDKTETTHHSDQLARYRKHVEASRDGFEVVSVYFKTGYHFERDHAARAHGYVVVNLVDLVEILRAHPSVPSDIFRDYARHQEAALTERARVLGALAGAGGARELHRDYAQHAFLALLRDRAKVPGDSTSIHHGSNKGGTPWAHWKFADVSNALPGGIEEKLFHRVDARQDGRKRRYYVSTRQYAQVKHSPGARLAKLSRLKQYQALYREAIAAAGTPLRFGRPSGDHRGANESEVGVLFFDDEQTTAVVLEHFPGVHREFVARLRSRTVPVS